MSESYQSALTLEDLRHNIKTIESRIAAACARVGRSATEVNLLPVTKTVDEVRLRMAYAAGLRTMGENKVQEAYGKWQAMADLTDLHWALIGHLQTNKVRQVAEFASSFHALDSLRVAEALDRKLQEAGRGMDVLVQVNTSGEQSKFGMPPEEALSFIKALTGFSSLRVRGLMTLAMHTTEEQAVRTCFRTLRDLLERARQETPFGAQLAELSMGMSGDFEWAVEEGSTIVRVGQAIFGSRSTPDSIYWSDTPEAPEGS